MIAQGMTEVSIAKKLGVDKLLSLRIFKALKLISKQFIYDITKSEYYILLQTILELVKHVPYTDK